MLAPSSGRGWVSGQALLALDPTDLQTEVPIDEAATQLESTYDAQHPELVAVLAEYDGHCTIARYPGGFVRTESGWRQWGVASATGIVPVLLPESDPVAPLLDRARWDMSGREYRRAVETVRDRIARGDVYVLNLTARLAGELTVPSPAHAFAQLHARARADMAAYWAGLPGTVSWIASVSPERFVRVHAGEPGSRVVEVCPIKGTRPRGASAHSDHLAAGELADDAKELAEHVMIVDLERNDLGVTCQPGTVHVDPLYQVETTPYCHQLVSTVRGSLRTDATFPQLLSAVFPCGSVTGAPKRAAMRIIEQLEDSQRGAYCGALLVAVPGELDSSVLIRTLESDAEKPDRAVWGSGCGITHDSDPAAEHLEMLLKASPVTGDGAPALALRETMRVSHGRAPLIERHLARLAIGGAGPSVLALVRGAVAAQLALPLAQSPYARLGITVTPDGEVAAGLTSVHSSLAVEGGPRIAVVAVDVVPSLPDGAAKPASRRYWDRAHNTARARGADQAVLVDHEGMLIDGSTATVWLVRDGELLTPPAPPAVAGVARELVFDLAAQSGMVARETPLRTSDLESADEVFLSNAVGLIAPARGRGGAVCARISQQVRQIFDSRQDASS